MSDLYDELAEIFSKQRAEGWGWRYDGVRDWPTEKIIAQLCEIGIDTDAERFAQQAAAAGRFETLQHDWVEQILPEKKARGLFWLDLPLVGIPVLWERLAPQVICADLIEERLHRALKAEGAGEKPPDVDGLPAELAAAMELVRFLQAVEPSQRAARFDEVNERRFYDYLEWLHELVESRGAEFPDPATQIADVMSDCRDPERFQADLSMALAMAGRREDAISRAIANVGRFPDDIWVRISAGDVLEELGDETEAIRYWLDALKVARDPDGWAASVERLEEAFDRDGRHAEFEEIRRMHPAPADDSDGDVSSLAALPPMRRIAADPEVVPDIGPRAQLTRAPKIGRNDPCPCGSGKKYKKCCLP